jgi:restriction system protein
MWSTSDFSNDARNYVKGTEQRVILVDGTELAHHLFDFDVGATPVGAPYILKRVDLDFFPDVEAPDPQDALGT